MSRHCACKRMLDIGAASAALVGLAPLIGATAAAVWWESGRPVIFAQRRVGKDRQGFTIYKFRSMHTARGDAPPARGGGDPSGGDDAHRVTRVGRFIRRWALDELPQLVNVLRGEMSLVGPRPLIPQHDDLLRGHQAGRRAALPGMTGWAAVTGGGALSWDERVEQDLYYLRNASMWLDVAILLMSIPAIASYGEPHGGPGRVPESLARGGQAGTGGTKP
ncbi:MAG: sugar transferase [Myxococcota bacterium]|nr:sugar transferase [Myxococcota bacterium]